MRQIFLVANFRRKNNLLKNGSTDKNVSRGQMRDQIVAIPDPFY
jgi:hypothetical protein